MTLCSSQNKGFHSLCPLSALSLILGHKVEDSLFYNLTQATSTHVFFVFFLYAVEKMATPKG